MVDWSSKLKKSTKGLHGVSDAVVNAKLVFALVDHQSFGEALCIFYPIYKTLEIQLAKYEKELPILFENHVLKRKLKHERRKSFEKDLQFYLGDKWMAISYGIAHKKEIQDYIDYLKSLPPERLLPYFYHLNLAILSGGHIIKKMVTRSLTLNKETKDGVQIFQFKDEESRGKLKQNVKDDVNMLLNEAYEKFETEQEKAEFEKLIIEESKKVFLNNNKIVGTYRVDWGTFLKKKGQYLIYFIVLGCLIFMFFYRLLQIVLFRGS